MLGAWAGYSNTTGSTNSFMGYDAGELNTTGYANTFIGIESGGNNTTGYSNSFLGDSAGYLNTTGTFNDLIGHQTGYKNSTGTMNVMMGSWTGYNTTNSYNAFFGSFAGYANTTGFNNCFLGEHAGYTSTIGNNLTMLGTYAGPAPSTPNLSYATAVGAYSQVTCSNCLSLGGVFAGGTQTRVGINNTTPLTDLHIIQQSNANFDNGRGIRLQSPNGKFWHFFLDPGNNFVFEYNTGVFAYIDPITGNFVSTSDSRLKTNITALSGVLDKVLLLEPKTYQYSASIDANRYTFGFLAQDVEKIFPEFVYTGEGGYKGIAYSNFSVISIKAIQEQQQLIQDQNQLIDQQKQKIDRMEQQMEEILKELSALRKKVGQ